MIYKLLQLGEKIAIYYMYVVDPENVINMPWI